VDAASGPAEQAMRVAVAARAGDEDPFADAGAGSRPGVDDAADRFVARDEGVAHAGEGRHGAGPEKLFGTAADPAPGDLDQQLEQLRAALD